MLYGCVGTLCYLDIGLRSIFRLTDAFWVLDFGFWIADNDDDDDDDDDVAVCCCGGRRNVGALNGVRKWMRNGEVAEWKAWADAVSGLSGRSGLH